MQGQRWTAKEVQYLILSHSTHSLVEQTAALKRSRWAVAHKRAELVKKGLLDFAKARHVRSQAVARRVREQMEALYSDGYTAERVAKRVGRAAVTVQEHLASIGGKQAGGRGTFLYSPEQVGTIMGASKSSVLRWLRNGWLRPIQMKRRRRSGVLIHHEALSAFLALREAWPAWSVERMTDRYWREVAQEARAQAGGVWLSPRDIARRYGYTTHPVHNWLGRGLLPSIMVGRFHYVWSTDLDGFIPPLEDTATPVTCVCCGREWLGWKAHACHLGGMARRAKKAA